MRRVAVTGLGVVAPNGVGKDAFWNACVEGHSGVGPITSFDASNHPTKIAAEVKDLDLMEAVWTPAVQRVREEVADMQAVADEIAKVLDKA